MSLQITSLEKFTYGKFINIQLFETTSHPFNELFATKAEQKYFSLPEVPVLAEPMQFDWIWKMFQAIWNFSRINLQPEEKTRCFQVSDILIIGTTLDLRNQSQQRYKKFYKELLKDQKLHLVVELNEYYKDIPFRFLQTFQQRKWNDSTETSELTVSLHIIQCILRVPWKSFSGYPIITVQ